MAKKNLIGLLVGAGVLLIVALMVVSSYNGLVSKRNDVKVQENNVGVMYARKLDLLPGMEDLAQKALKNETAFVEKVTALRSGCASLGALDDHTTCDGQMREAGNLMINIINERYPQLQSIVLYQNVQTELVNSVNKIAFEQVHYNEIAGDYNKKVQSFPSVLTAKLFGFKEAKLIGTKTTGGSNASLGTNNLS